jgi:hypothetical protein
MGSVQRFFAARFSAVVLLSATYGRTGFRSPKLYRGFESLRKSLDYPLSE